MTVKLNKPTFRTKRNLKRVEDPRKKRTIVANFEGTSMYWVCYI